jgi:hypothetical protein
MAGQARAALDYKITFLEIEREVSGAHFQASYVYTFQISNIFLATRGTVVLTNGGAEIIEKRGLDPIDTARAVLRQILDSGRDPFETEIFLRVPIEYAESFSQHGNFDGLPGLVA